MRDYAKPLLIARAAAVTVIAALLVVAAPWSGSSSAGSDLLQGDNDCNRAIEVVDALFGLRFVAQLEPFGDCTEEAGDTDCSGALEVTDALHILRHLVAFPKTTSPDCPAVGEPLQAVTPSPTVSPTETPAATASPGPTEATAIPTPKPTVTATPTSTITPPTETPATSPCVDGPPLTPTPAGPARAPAGAPLPQNYSIEPFITADQLSAVMDMAVIPGTNGEQAVVALKSGLLYRVPLSGAPNVTLFGDIRDRVNGASEEGLLSLAFSPGYEEDRCLFLYYTTDNSTPKGVCTGSDRCSKISRFIVNGTDMDEGSETSILEIGQPFNNHNGGRLLFGPDGLLYLSLGDGGSAGDPLNHGQNIDTLLGSIIRIDVTGQQTYAVPPDNPFVGTAGADEIYAYGFRNPWRWSFDRETGDIWVGDVGQGSWEEVGTAVKGGNHGWRCYEGFAEFNTTGCPPPETMVFPRAVYPIANQPECAVVGGYVYRGTQMPELRGWLVYGDFCSGKIWAVNVADSGDPVPLVDTNKSITSFFELPNGELLILGFDSTIHRLVRN
jgi:glucose/arabinose dehydrogenase